MESRNFDRVKELQNAMCISESTKARNMVYTILEMADTGDLGKEKI